MLAQSQLVTIACDESGAECENLMNSADPVFVHASTALQLQRANEIINDLREATRTQVPEIKSKVALSLRHRPALLATLEAIIESSNIYLVNKTFYTSAKLVDLLVAKAARLRGADIAASGEAAQIARTLYLRAPAALGAVVWRELLTSFNDLIRGYAREGTVPPTADMFLGVLYVAREFTRDREVADVLDQLWQCQHLVLEHENSAPSLLREMDPTASSMTTVARTLRMRLGDMPFEFLADNYWGLTIETRELIIEVAGQRLSVANFESSRANLRAIRLVDPTIDARIQLADILAGVGQEISSLAFEGVFDCDLQISVSDALGFNDMWVIGSPLDILSERRPPRYLRG
jgi:Protein of unknown function (DUF3800)